jgi:L-alanine-DL-glutamate epimerase-like enolase superfamily enzyme
MNCSILSAEVSFRPQPFARPLQLSSGTITEITEATATVTVRIGTREATGKGSIYLSDLWAWPDPAIPHSQRDAAMQDYCSQLAADLPGLSGPQHPLSHGMDLLSRNAHHAGPGRIPFLAGSVCLSPFDAAIHDAAGHALQRSAFHLYDDAFADRHTASPAQLAAIRRFLRQTPSPEVDGWYVVSATDPLTSDFHHFIQHHGFRCFKLKTLGKDPDADARRTADVFDAAQALGVSHPRLSADSNEGNPDAQSVATYLDALQSLSPAAYEALAYLEQPTGRDIRTHAFDWHSIAARKPILVDEGLMEPSILPVIEQQGWSGICLKTCKGHSFNLIAGAWAASRGLLTAVQDLTNPGLAAIHSCLLAQHTPSLNGVELNSPQFTPAANDPWASRLPSLFSPTDGSHHLPNPLVHGLGSLC